MVSVTVDGETVQLAMRIYKPAIVGPAPTLVFNHGSTGRGNDSSLFVRPLDFPPLAQFFVERGWAVVMPARRGRGGSEGQDDEGFAPDRSTTIAIDVAKSVFEVAVSEQPGQVCDCPRLSREQFRRFLTERPAATILMDACGSAHREP